MRKLATLSIAFPIMLYFLIRMLKFPSTGANMPNTILEAQIHKVLKETLEGI